MFKSDAKLRSDASVIHCQDFDLATGEVINLVQQQYKDECDLNVVLGRLTPEQLEDRLAASNGVYGDYYDVMSYADAKMLVIQAESAFDMLPAKLRGMFDNSIEKFLQFMDNPANEEEAVKLGLKVRQEPLPTPKVEEKVSDEVKG